jgi:hypothetical protein
MTTTWQPFLTSDQVQDLRRATELAAERGVQRYARRFAVLLVISALAAGSIVHTLDAWLLASPLPLRLSLPMKACGGR